MYGEPHVTVGYTEMLSVAQQCFCGRFMSPAKIARFFFRFLPDLEFLGRFSSKSPTSNFTAVRPVGLALMLAERQMDGHGEVNRCFSRLYEDA